MPRFWPVCLLACLASGFLVFWHDSLLAYWSSGLLVFWHASLLAFLFLAFWHALLLACWLSSGLFQVFFGPPPDLASSLLAYWPSDFLASFFADLLSTPRWLFGIVYPHSSLRIVESAPRRQAWIFLFTTYLLVNPLGICWDPFSFLW
jgi:hypothetical protein